MQNTLSMLYLVTALIVSTYALPISAEVIVHPYLQNSTQSAITVSWVTQSSTTGTLVVSKIGGRTIRTLTSKAELRPELQYSASERASSLFDSAIAPPYLYRIRVENLEPDSTYAYSVRQGNREYSRQFRTAPNALTPIRFIVYADSETEPESTLKRTKWPEPNGAAQRLYVVDQTEGYRQNLKIIKERLPDFVAIAGDIVESGGEQRDWDEFWRHNSGAYSDIAGWTPLIPALGNHENYSGKKEKYSSQGAQRAVRKFQAYFETPDNGMTNRLYEDRFYRLDYGPVSLITLDTSNGAPDNTGADTNFFLEAKNSESNVPDFNPGSAQYMWLEKQLADAQSNSHFTFVQFHHAPYSVGPHGVTAGKLDEQDPQSGQPTRVLSPLFEKYGVAAVFSGHDEMYEHSIVNGVHYYDIGIGGDGLRAPNSTSAGKPDNSTNPYQVYLAHTHSPEVWRGKQLLSGGKHYGHLEVNVSLNEDQMWTAELTPVYVFPKMDDSGAVVGWERRIYDDTTLIHR